MKTVKQILEDDIPEEIIALFQFTVEDSNELIIKKYKIWCRYFFPKYFISKQTGKTIEDATFHAEIDLYNVLSYKGDISSFTNIVFRGGAKTTRTKLFLAFAILNDENHYRKYIKVLTKDLTNSKQSVTDIYNMFVSPKIIEIYQSVFEKSDYKREETMHTFTTSFGVKVLADTVGVDQRGQLQEDARPDLIWFDDFETRLTLRSAVMTQSIWDNMEEARTGLAVNGSCLYTCNYVSERGNVHKLVLKKNQKNILLIVPIIKNGVSAWKQMYSIERIEVLRTEADDFEGEYLCEPSAGADVLFDRDNLKKMEKLSAIRTVGDFKIFKRYDASHRYASGHDVGGGVGLDSSTSVFIDFDTIPCRVVATYKSNTVKPDVFGMEISQQGDRYGECLVAPEKNNHGHATIAILKTIYNNIYETDINATKKKEKLDKQKTEYGWHTNSATKPKMFMALRKAVDDGLLELSDENLIQEAMSYSRDDLMDKDIDPRLTTRHFDLLTACAIAWQMKDYATYTDIQTEEEIEALKQEDEDMTWEEKFGII